MYADHPEELVATARRILTKDKSADQVVGCSTEMEISVKFSNVYWLLAAIADVAVVGGLAVQRVGFILGGSLLFLVAIILLVILGVMLRGDNSNSSRGQRKLSNAAVFLGIAVLLTIASVCVVVFSAGAGITMAAILGLVGTFIFLAVVLVEAARLRPTVLA